MSFPLPLVQLLPSKLLALCEFDAVAPGAALFSTGEHPRWMFFVSKGEVVLERYSLDGQMVCLQRCQGGFLAEASLTSSRYHCDGRVSRTSQLTRVPIKALREALKQDSDFSQRWIDMLSREVRRLRLQNERLSLHKVQDRLLHLCETEGVAGRYKLTCSVRELASQLAVTHEALYRVIAQLVSQGRVERSGDVLALRFKPSTSPGSDAS